MSRRRVLLAALLWLPAWSAAAADAGPVIPEPVFVQDGGLSGGQLAITPPLGELPTDPSVWRLEATNGGEVTLLLDVAVALAEPGPDGAPTPGPTPAWATLPADQIQLAAGEVAQFGVAVDPSASEAGGASGASEGSDGSDGGEASEGGEGRTLLLTLTSTNVDPQVRVTALASIGGFSSQPVAAEIVADDGVIDTVTLTASGTLPATAGIEVARSRFPFGLGRRNLGTVTDLVVLPGTPRRVDLADFDGPTEVVVHSADATTTLSVDTPSTLLVATTAGAAALLGGGTVMLLRRQRRRHAMVDR